MAGGYTSLFNDRFQVFLEIAHRDIVMNMDGRSLKYLDKQDRCAVESLNGFNKGKALYITFAPLVYAQCFIERDELRTVSLPCGSWKSVFR